MRQANRVESISLHQIGVFDDLSIHFQPIESEQADAKKAEIHLLTGANGCGKSTILYALANIFDDTVNYFPEKSDLIRSRFRNSASKITFSFCGEIGLISTREEQTECYPIVNNPQKGKMFYFGKNKESSLFFYKNTANGQFKQEQLNHQTFGFAVFAYSGHRTITQEKLSGIQAISNSPFEDALSFNQTVRSKVLLQWIANNQTQSALLTVRNQPEKAKQYEQSLNKITNFINQITGLNIGFQLEMNPIEVSINMNDTLMQFDALPDGLKSIISWVADLALRLESIPWEIERDIFEQPIILLLDEIDIHLHPKWQRRILPAIQTLLPNAQIFASTHSPFVIGSVEDAWVYQLPEPVNGHSSGVIEGVKSGAGKSYRLILEETFGLNDEFDIETEYLFDQFYSARNETLATKQSVTELTATAKTLANRSEEASIIIQRELRQISRLIGQEISLA